MLSSSHILETLMPHYTNYKYIITHRICGLRVYLTLINRYNISIKNEIGLLIFAKNIFENLLELFTKLLNYANIVITYLL